ncbi:sensor histidine kinase KdpD [uncultured Williamsia sp.]|uniref:sensor histidine kinase n=1 Tax=uncultured Williamsia sp. TaxID=259311 RepID=UPI00260224AD|nr:sensor histidine kinase KdpD [uncultured Williamsia sp.]
MSAPTAPPRDAERRGTLQIFLGCAPGVGKTYEMLAQAKTLLVEGSDVVAAIVETHGRSATAQMADGIETVPTRPVEHRGTVLHELDVDAVLARRPDVVLVDELAHSNAPGMRNPKRWEDIRDLLDAGIDVLSTVNIQHLESLNDVVAEITGVTQRETVPDEVVRAADSIELVDIAPEALRRRLAAGKVYKGDRIQGALVNYFRQGNLTALRELALLWLADRVDDSLADYRAQNAITATWETRERVVVAVTGGAESATLLRRASRIASRSSAELIAVHVVRGDGLLDRLSGELPSLKDLAEGVGARIHTAVGDDIAETLLDFARGVNATQLVLGTSRRSRWQRLVSEGTGAAVVRMSGKIDVHMVTHDQAPRRNLLDIRQSRFRRPLTWVFAVLVPSAAAVVMYFADKWMGFATETAVFFLVVLAISLLGGVAPAALTAIVSGLLLNYFFTDPRYSFTIDNTENASTILVMLVVAIAVAALVDSASRRRREASRAAAEAELLTTFAGAVLSGTSPTTLLELVRDTFGQTAVSVVRLGGSLPVVENAVGTDPAARPGDADTVCTVASGEYAMLLRGPAPTGRDRRVLTAVATQAAGVVERRRLAEAASEARALAETDKLRRALLSAVSHDLRTPLAAVKAAASSLRSTDVSFSPEDTAELLATIEESTDHLTAIVGNLLDSSRLAAGVVRPQMRHVYLGEVVGRVLVGMASYATTATERVRVDGGHVLVWADPVLLERVLANLIDNALRHSGDATVTVRAEPDEPIGDVDDTTTSASRRVRVLVVDHGIGIDEGDRAAVLAAFHRLGDQNSSSGVGLGLSVASGFTEAMGGQLEVVETPGGGSTMVVDLPADATTDVTDGTAASREREEAHGVAASGT